MTSIKHKAQRQRRLDKLARNARKALRLADKVERGVRRIHPENVTPRAACELQRLLLDTLQAVRDRADAQLVAIGVFEGINEDS